MNDLKVFAWDIETDGLDGEACYVSWAHDGKVFGRPVTGPAELTDWLISEALIPRFARHIFVAHYGTRFDLLRLDWPRIAEAGFDARFYTAKNVNDILGVDFCKGRKVWRFRDSFRYFPSSLRDFVGLFAPDEKKGDLDFSTMTFDPDNLHHVAYAMNDSKILARACVGLDGFLKDEFDTSMTEAITASGVAFKAVKKHSKKAGYPEIIPVADFLEPIVRHSFHGGLVGAWRVGEFSDIVLLDFNSLYGSILLRHGLPSGAACLTRSMPRERDVPALVLARIDMRSAFPFVLSKDRKRGMGRWAGSNILTWAWDFELDVQAELGATVERQAWITWPTLDYRHQSFIEKCRALRKKDAKGPLGTLAKLMQNGCYGKYGSIARSTELRLCTDIPDDGTPVYDENGEPIPALWNVPVFENKRLFVHYASYVTAAGRCILMRALMRLPREQWLAGDTDSLMVHADFFRCFEDLLGDDYGALKIEAAGDVTIRAPKVYRIEADDGEVRYRNKGIPRALSEIAWTKGEVSYQAGKSLGVVMRRQTRDGGVEYAEMASRRLSGPGSVTQGYYDEAGRWQPGTSCDTVTPGLTLLGETDAPD
jgi:hypothetical protein